MNDRRERGTGRIFRRGRMLWIQYYHHGRQIRMSSQTDDPKRAARLLRKKIGEVEAGVHRDTHRITYEELRESYYQDFVTNQRKSLRRDKDGTFISTKLSDWIVSSRATAFRRSTRA